MTKLFENLTFPKTRAMFAKLRDIFFPGVPAGFVWNPSPPKSTLTDGSPVTPDHREINPATGQQKGYVVLSKEERAKGLVRPFLRSYVHEKCGTVTKMGVALAETYARQPDFYGGTFCVGCKEHFPVGKDGEFFWEGTSEKVGT